jgi:hypothetical protein
MHQSSTLGQEVLHGDIKRLGSDLCDIHRLTPKTNEDTEFQRRLIVKLNWRDFSKSGNWVE